MLRKYLLFFIFICMATSTHAWKVVEKESKTLFESSGYILILEAKDTDLRNDIVAFSAYLTKHLGGTQETWQAQLMSARLSIWKKTLPKDFWTHVFKMPFLLVLDLTSCSLTELPKNIGDLKELRFLALNNNALESLPDSIATLEHLENLQLYGQTAHMHIPQTLLTLAPQNGGKLTSLYIDTLLNEDNDGVTYAKLKETFDTALK